MADSGTRRHDGLDAAVQKLDIRDSGPRRVEGSPRLHEEGTVSYTHLTLPTIYPV